MLFSWWLVWMSSNVYSEKLPEEIELSVAYNFVSHQNPWEKSAIKYKKVAAIQIGKGEFLALSGQEEVPVFARMESGPDSSVTNLKLTAYDPGTGLSIFQSGPFVVPSRIFSIEQFEFEKCKNDMDEIFLISQKSGLILRVYTSGIGLSRNANGILFRQKENICGIRFENTLLDIAYIREFLRQKKMSEIFPHPGLLPRFDLTNDEKLFYFGKDRDGVVVEKVYPGVGPVEFLQPMDRILGVNGVPISGNSSQKKKVFFNSILFSGSKLKKLGESVHLELFRNGTAFSKSFVLKKYSEDEFLIPEKFEDEKRFYMIEGGLVFAELSGAYLKESGKDYRRKSHKKLLYIYEHYKYKSHPFRKRLVIISRVLPDAYNSKMRNLEDEMVEKANGENVVSLNHLYSIFANSKKEVLLEFSNGEFFLLDKSELFIANRNIKKLYSLSSLSNLGD